MYDKNHQRLDGGSNGGAYYYGFAEETMFRPNLSLDDATQLPDYEHHEDESGHADNDDTDRKSSIIEYIDPDYQVNTSNVREFISTQTLGASGSLRQNEILFANSTAQNIPNSMAMYQVLETTEQPRTTTMDRLRPLCSDRVHFSIQRQHENDVSNQTNNRPIIHSIEHVVPSSSMPPLEGDRTAVECRSQPSNISNHNLGTVSINLTRIDSPKGRVTRSGSGSSYRVTPTLTDAGLAIEQLTTCAGTATNTNHSQNGRASRERKAAHDQQCNDSTSTADFEETTTCIASSSDLQSVANNQTSAGDHDDDFCFLKSLLPYMRVMTVAEKLKVRMKVNKIIFKQLYGKKGKTEKTPSNGKL